MQMMLSRLLQPGMRVHLVRDCSTKAGGTCHLSGFGSQKEDGKVLSQVDHHRNVVRDAQLKLQKHQGVLQDLLERSQSLQLEINSLQVQVEAAKAASASVVPPMPPPSVPLEGTPPVNADDPSGGQIDS